MTIKVLHNILQTAKRFWLSFSSALTFLRNFCRTSREERLAWKDPWRLKFEAVKFEPSILITFYHWKFFTGTGDWTQICTPTVFDAFYCKAALMQTWKLDNNSSRWGYRPYPLRFNVKEAGADAKLTQHGPLEVAYHRRHPISTLPVARITAHATMPG